MPLPDPFAAFRLHGRTALVTGARREIGRAIALALGAAGARVAVHHTGTAEEAGDAAEVIATLQEGGVEAAAFAADFVAPDAGRKLARAVTAALGHVDILVLNASIEIREHWAEISAEHFDRQVNVNLRATLDLLQELGPLMAERGWGRIVTIGSVQQVWPAASMMVYAGYKAMQLNWAMNLARQLGPSGVTVNNLAPGVILTSRNRDHLGPQGDVPMSRIPVGRFGRPDDLVGAALLLCSDAGSYINGANLFVDGGRTVA
jgi:NAD(P)-dependent dehydrogenase (short-subunit alcohol dehydrogenase family)